MFDSTVGNKTINSKFSILSNGRWSLNKISKGWSQPKHTAGMTLDIKHKSLRVRFQYEQAKFIRSCLRI